MYFWKKRPKTAKNQGKLHKNALKICKSMQTSNITAGKEPKQPLCCSFTTFFNGFYCLDAGKNTRILETEPNTHKYRASTAKFLKIYSQI